MESDATYYRTGKGNERLFSKVRTAQHVKFDQLEISM